jgi:hypothetical protein
MIATNDMNIFRGERKQWTVTVRDAANSAVNLASASAWFTVRTVVPAGTVTADTDAAVVIAKKMNTGIVIASTAGGQFQITLDKADTYSLTAIDMQRPVQYLYGIEYKPTAQADPVVIAQGNFFLYCDIVRSV